MTQFPSSKHLASWSGVSPGNHESAGKKKASKTVKGNPHIKTALCQVAWAISRSEKHTLLLFFGHFPLNEARKKRLQLLHIRFLESSIPYFQINKRIKSLVFPLKLF